MKRSSRGTDRPTVAAFPGPGEAAGQAATSTGALSAGAGTGTRRRRRTAVVALVCAGLLVGGFLLRSEDGRQHAVHPAAAPAAGHGRPSPGGPLRVVVTGPRDAVVEAPDTELGIALTAARRVPSAAGRSTLELMLHVDVARGAQVLTTNSFTISAPGGGTPVPASGVTVLRPDARLVPADGGFRIGAPSSVDVVVLLDVVPGDHVVSLRGDDAGRALARFAISG